MTLRGLRPQPRGRQKIKGQKNRRSKKRSTTSRESIFLPPDFFFAILSLNSDKNYAHAIRGHLLSFRSKCVNPRRVGMQSTTAPRALKSGDFSDIKAALLRWPLQRAANSKRRYFAWMAPICGPNCVPSFEGVSRVPCWRCGLVGAGARKSVLAGSVERN